MALLVNRNIVDRALIFIDLFNFHSCTSQGYDELKKNCQIICKYIPFMTGYINSTITRCRRNENELYHNKSEISYNKNLDLIYAGRFNLPKQTMFYGSLPTFKEDGSYVNYGNQCPMFEVCKELQNNNELHFPTFFTLGFWGIIDELHVVSLCFDRLHLQANAGIHQAYADFEKMIDSKYSRTDAKYIRHIWRYFSELSRNWNESNCHYYNILTAFYSSFVMHYKGVYKKDIHGIIYPSAMTQAKGLNIAINPQNVDQQMKLEAVQMYTLKHRGLPYAYEPITNVVAIQSDNFEFDKSFEEEFNRFNLLRTIHRLSKVPPSMKNFSL